MSMISRKPHRSYFKNRLPSRIGFRILFFVAITTLVSRAGLGSRRGIDSELQPLGVDVITKRLHIGKPAVGVDISRASRWPSQVSSTFT